MKCKVNLEFDESYINQKIKELVNPLVTKEEIIKLLFNKVNIKKLIKETAYEETQRYLKENNLISLFRKGGKK